MTKRSYIVALGVLRLLQAFAVALLLYFALLFIAEGHRWLHRVDDSTPEVTTE